MRLAISKRESLLARPFAIALLIASTTKVPEPHAGSITRLTPALIKQLCALTENSSSSIGFKKSSTGNPLVGPSTANSTELSVVSVETFEISLNGISGTERKCSSCVRNTDVA